jgi:Raf kinase inhibitor-like YbhB/YbcL family protein
MSILRRDFAHLPQPDSASKNREVPLNFSAKEDMLLQLHSDSFKQGGTMPGRLAFARIGKPVLLADNQSPHLAWQDAPENTRSFALTCIDTDAPSKADDVNQAERIVPADLPRVAFVHWLMADIPATCQALSEGACSKGGVVAHGKRNPWGPPGSIQGMNDYTAWFAGDATMAGNYLGYDGPCPPWNDSRIHHYHFRLYALDTRHLGLAAGFTLQALREAMAGHVLVTAEWVGTYTLNPVLADVCDV